MQRLLIAKKAEEIYPDYCLSLGEEEPGPKGDERRGCLSIPGEGKGRMEISS
jgi:hypothetical protein